MVQVHILYQHIWNFLSYCIIRNENLILNNKNCILRNQNIYYQLCPYQG